MLGAQIMTCQCLSCHCWQSCTMSACFHDVGTSHKSTSGPQQHLHWSNGSPF